MTPRPGSTSKSYGVATDMDNSFEVMAFDVVDGFFAPDIERETCELDRQVREVAYVAEVEEIEKLTETLSGLRLAQTDLSPEDRDKGLSVLAARRELVESLYDGRSIDEIREEKFEKLDQCYVATGKVLTPLAKAKIRGQQTYQSDSKCRNGHINPERNTSNSLCLECGRLRSERSHIARKQRVAATI